MLSSSNKRILVLDDDPDDTLLISDAIADIGETLHVVTVTHTPEEAREQLLTNSFDIILCDYRLGAIEGTEFIAEIRKNGTDAPIILLTGRSDKAAEQAGVEAGASDFICKADLSPEILDRTIRYSIANAERQRMMNAVLSSLSAAVCVLDTSRQPVLWNPAFANLAETFATDPGNLDAIVRLCEEVKNGENVQTIAEQILDKTIADLEDGRSVIALHDVTEHLQAIQERQRAESKAAHLARHCSLTGLPNRNAFVEHIAAEIERATETGTQLYLVNLNLKRFKEVNDIYGHDRGDELLNLVAQRLQSRCADDVYLARVAGDEFAAILEKRPQDDDIPVLAHVFADAIDEGFPLADKLVKTSASVGVAVFPEHGTTAQELMSNADIAMSRSKIEPGSVIHAYNSDLDQAIRERRQLTNDLKIAVEREEIEVHFQPQARVADGEIIGFEALARWQHPEHGYISPAVFVPIAEEIGLIETIGRQVLKKSCECAANWPKPVTVSVNLSAIQIRQTDLVAMVHTTLLESGLPAKRLELEVTESVLIDDFTIALKVLRGIKSLGISLAMDDFGTGFSSLSSLVTFPFDKLKIDRSFIMELDNNQQLAAIVRAIIGMGENLGLTIIAEGVEKPSHVEFLAQENCDEMQGFLLGKPMSNDSVTELLNVPATNLLYTVEDDDSLVA